MNILFLVIYVVGSQLVHNVATDQSMGLAPYRLGATLQCLLFHPIILVCCIWYCGWGVGILLFLCELFSIVHSTIGWLLNIRGLFLTNAEQIIRKARFYVAMLTPMLIVTILFCVISFFVTPYKGLLAAVKGNTTLWIVTGIIIAVSSIARIIVAKTLPD